jgi:hypothetical protein
MNRIFFFILMMAISVWCGQLSSHAIAQMDSVFYTPPYVHAGRFSLHKAQPYQMGSSFGSKFVPLSSKKVGNLSQFTTPSLSASVSIPPANLIFPSNSNAVNLTTNFQPTPKSVVAPRTPPVQSQMKPQRAVVRTPQVARGPSSRSSVLQYQASTIPALNIKDGKSIQPTSANFPIRSGSFPDRSGSQVAYQPAGLVRGSIIQQTAVAQSTLGLAPPWLSPVSVVGPPASSNLPATVCCLPPSAYQNVVGTSKTQSAVVSLQNMPQGTYVGRGLVGQPAAYIDGQPLRNLIRYITF